MKYIQFGIAVLLVAAIGIPTGSTYAQELELAPESELSIDGTSNRDDWTVYAKDVSARATGAEDSTVPSELEVTVVAAEIKSDNSTIMDRLIQQSLNVSDHPTITYELLDAQPSGDDETILTTTGRLTLAGVSREIEMDVQTERLEGGSVRYTGMTPLKFTDFDLQPPTAMFGALRTGDDVTVHFDVTFVPSG